MSLLLVAVGAVLLYVGGDLLVKYSVNLARHFNLSPLVVGLTVVAFGTSAPELAATLASTLSGAPGIALGNILGSNAANVGLILGVTALLYPLQGSRAFVRRELPLGVAAVLVLVPLLLNGVLGRLEAALLLALLGAYLTLLVKSAKSEAELTGDLPEAPSSPLWRSLLLIVLSVGLLVVGARVLITGAVATAQALGVPEKVIGFTLVAFGTSLPELASSVAAALRKETDIILGNIAGSNLFNVLAVLGVTGIFTPLAEPFVNLRLDILVTALFSAALLALMLRTNRLGRTGGTLLLVGYLSYVVYLFV